MLRSTSVVMTTTERRRLIEVSPVKSPTRERRRAAQSSWYFWLDSALRGVV